VQSRWIRQREEVQRTAGDADELVGQAKLRAFTIRGPRKLSLVLNSGSPSRYKRARIPNAGMIGPPPSRDASLSLKQAPAGLSRPTPRPGEEPEAVVLLRQRFEADQNSKNEEDRLRRGHGVRQVGRDEEAAVALASAHDVDQVGGDPAKGQSMPCDWTVHLIQAHPAVRRGSVDPSSLDGARQPAGFPASPRRPSPVGWLRLQG
jgi:hypothetical protein